ncbi:MAG: GGDEF domain-containing protein [Candidatus Eremiobacteraeota bacterium]|nr:GGDEF domain-containing protein [Candidatus Eremiobacteraeota bacterium]
MEEIESTTEVLGFAPRYQHTSEQKQLCLVVVTGAEKGAVFPLQAGTTTLGRSAQHAELVISGRGLSRAHARLEISESGEVAVEDLESTNGLFINGEKMIQGTLKPGDTLTLGPEVSLRLDAPDQSIQSLLQEMHKGATVDALTGLINRRSFLERLEGEISATHRHSLQACLAMVDVDHFKAVNDTYGHAAGDAVLVEVAQRLAKHVRQEDVVARFGGEEFVILLRHTDLAGAVVLLDRLRAFVSDKTIEVPSTEGRQPIQVTFSAGITQIDQTSSSEQLLERADVALYQAKRLGRDRVETSF